MSEKLNNKTHILRCYVKINNNQKNTLLWFTYWLLSSYNVFNCLSFSIFGSFTECSIFKTSMPNDNERRVLVDVVVGWSRTSFVEEYRCPEVDPQSRGCWRRRSEGNTRCRRRRCHRSRNFVAFYSLVDVKRSLVSFSFPCVTFSGFGGRRG